MSSPTLSVDSGTASAEPRVSWRGKVLIVGPGRRTEGGITEVIARIIACFENDPAIDAVWVETHRSGGTLAKLGQALIGLAQQFGGIAGADIVHIHSSASVSFIRKSIFYWIARAFRKPVVWHLHSPDIDFSNFFGKAGAAGRYARYILARCARVVVLSSGWVNLARDTLPGARIDVIYNPVPLASKSMPHASEKESQRILYLAHLIPRKGYSFLIRAFAEIADEFPASRLVFAGSGEVDAAKALCDELGVTDRVEFLGWIGDAERGRELGRAGVLALPSYQEGLPMNVLEAMKFGIAVVTTPVGGIPDVISDGYNGLLVPPGDASQLADALRRLFRDEALHRSIGEAAKQSVAPFEPETIAADWKDLYNDIMSAKTTSEAPT